MIVWFATLPFRVITVAVMVVALPFWLPVPFLFEGRWAAWQEIRIWVEAMGDALSARDLLPDR